MHPHTLFALSSIVTLAASSTTARAEPPAPPQNAEPPVVRSVPSPLPEPDVDTGADTVLGDHVSHGGYGGPSLKITTLGGRGTMLAGGEGGWIIGRALVLGGSGYGSITDALAPSALQSPSGNSYLSIGYGGFRLGGIFSPRKLTHVTLGVLVGGGGATTATRDGAFRARDSFFVVEPDLSTEVNLAKHVRLALGGSYRFVGSTDVTGFTATRLNGPSATLAVRFGIF